MTKNRSSKRALSIALTLMLGLGIFSTMPLSAHAVDIGVPSDLTLDTGRTAAATPAGSTVYYGGSLYRVVAKDGTTSMTLFMDGNLGTRAYDATAHDAWSGSDICDYLNTTFLATFSTAEQSAITTYGTTGVTDTANSRMIDEDQKFVLPSYAEVINGGTWVMNKADRSHSVDWWLRSPGNNTSYAAVVDYDGNVHATGISVSYSRAVRPAFKLNLSSVIFTSAAAGGKSSATVGSALEAAQPPNSGAVKLTVLDSSLTLDSADINGVTNPTVKSGDTLTVNYSGASISANTEFISCVLVNSSGAITHYGKLANGGGATGAPTFTVPAVSELPNGAYTLRVFAEDVNGDNLTDFASTPVDLSLTVANPVQYSVLNGFPAVTDKSATNISAKIDANYDQFFDSGTLHGSVENVTNTETLTPVTHYTHEDGSTIITLTPAYLSTLSNGTYQMRVNFASGGTATTTLTVAIPGTGGSTTSGNPKTADDTPLGLMFALIAVAGAALIVRRRFAKN